MKRLIVSTALVAVTVAGFVVVNSSTPAGAGITPLGTLSVAPEPSNLGTAVTVTPSVPCPPASTEVALNYTLSNGTSVDSVVIPVGSNGAWTDSVTPDAAGDYFVSGSCQHTAAAPNAGHLSVAGQPTITDSNYASQEFHVNGLLAAAPSPATVGDSVTFTPTFTDPAVGSRCPNGTVTLTITDPDSTAIVTNAAPTVATDGSFSLAQIVTKVGTYTVTGACHRVLAAGAAGHLAVSQSAFTNDFTYSGSVQVAAQATTTTTTEPPAPPAAEAVTATPTFTG